MFNGVLQIQKKKEIIPDTFSVILGKTPIGMRTLTSYNWLKLSLIHYIIMEILQKSQVEHQDRKGSSALFLALGLCNWEHFEIVYCLLDQGNHFLMCLL